MRFNIKCESFTKGLRILIFIKTKKVTRIYYILLALLVLFVYFTRTTEPTYSIFFALKLYLLVFYRSLHTYPIRVKYCTHPRHPKKENECQEIKLFEIFY